jgi:hypothetical protein
MNATPPASPEPSQEEQVTSESFSRMRQLVYSGLNYCATLEEQFQGVSRPESWSQSLSGLIRTLSQIEEQAEQIDSDILTLPEDLVRSLATQSNESVEILAKVKGEIDVAAARAKAQVHPFTELRKLVADAFVAEDLDQQFEYSITNRGLMRPPFLTR